MDSLTIKQNEVAENRLVFIEEKLMISKFISQAEVSFTILSIMKRNVLSSSEMP